MKKITLLILTFLLSFAGFSQILSEGFEGGTFPPTAPGNWAVFQNGFGSNTWVSNTTLPRTGAKAAQINSRQNIGMGNTSKDFLATPLVTIPMNGQLRFWARTTVNGNQGTKYQVRIASGALPANQTDETAYTTLVQEWTEDQLSTTYNVYEEKVINFAPALWGMPVYIAFVDEYTQTGTGLSGDTWLLDDIMFDVRCLDPTTLTATVPTATSMNLGWTNPSGSTSWEIEIMPSGPALPTGTGTVVFTNPYTATATTLGVPFQPLTAYKFYVRSICTFSNSQWIGPYTFTTGAAPPICGGNFVDSGGTTANYPNSSDSTVTIFPVTPGDKVTVTFTSFSTEATYDGLYVFNGNSTAAPQIPSANPAGAVPGGLAGSYWGATIPGPFTSTAADGSLTFRFRSDGSVNNPGWISNITCAPPPTCVKPITLTTTAITANSVTVGWTQPINPDLSQATEWEVLALPCGSPLPTAGATGWEQALTNPFIMQGLAAGTCYDFYVRAVCSPTDSSTWAGPKTATTQPGCGGGFFDAGGPTANYPNNSDSTVTICPTNPGDVVTVTFTSFNTEVNWDGLYVFDGNSITAPQIASANPAGSVPGGLGGSYWGTIIPGPFTSSSPDGCLTFRFRSDGSFNNPGWVANVTCAPPPTCSKPKVLTVTGVTQTTAVLGWTQPVNPDTSVATAWEVLVLPCGSPAPTAGATGGIGTLTNPYTATGLSSATCYEYYVRAVCSATDSSVWSGPKSFNTLIENDECTGSIQVPVNQNTNCLQVVPGTISGATGSLQANTCGATADNDDVWFHFVATATTHYISLLDATATLNYALYTGTVCGSLTQVGGCINGNGGVANSLVIGQTYRVRVYSPGTTAASTTFKICIGTNSGTCPSALPLCAITPIIFPNNVGVPSTAGTTGCLGSAPAPTYYYLQIPISGNYVFFIEQNTNNTFTGAGLDVDFVSWGPYASNAIACSTITQGNTRPAPLGCSFSAAPTETFTVNGAIAGQVYVLMITNYTAQTLPGKRGFIRITQTSGPIPTVCCPYTNFTYPGSFFCKNGTNPLPTVASGATSGTYSSTAGLVIDPITGEINLAASTAGTYSVTNTVLGAGSCPISVSTWSVTITAPPTPSISYSAPSYCSNDNTLQTPAAPVTTGGTYSASPAVGLSLNAVTGEFTPSTSIPGTYTVSYTIAASAGCPSFVATTQVIITPLPIAGFSYDSATYCQNGVDPIIAFDPGAVAGVFTSTAGLSIDPATGAIDLSLSTPGNYTITNTIVASGGCPDVVATFSILITAPPTADFSYTGSPYCQDAANPSPTFSGGGVAGVFSSTSGLVINSTTGEINLVASTPGTYTVENLIVGAGGCGDVTATTTVTITVVPQATISYSPASYCYNNNTAQSVNQTGTAGGTYTATPAGLSIDSVTGEITPNTSAGGFYTVTYTIAASGGCAALPVTTTVTIIPEVAVEITEACQGPLFVLTAMPVSGSFDPTLATYTWSGPDGFTFGPSSEPSVVIPADGDYISTVTYNGCTNVNSHNVTSILCEIQLGISPNGDGKNEDFLLSDVKKLNIYNRYGTKVYNYGQGYTNQWHGQSEKGDELPDGTYFYVVERNSGGSITGWVYINR